MKTTFFVHGGQARTVNYQNDLFYSEILKGFSGMVKVLLVEFASDPDKIQKHITQDSAQFLKNAKSKKILFEIADPNKLEGQIKDTDIVYLSGAKTSNLLNALSKIPQFKSWIEGKVVVGESAGAKVLSTYCYSKSAGGITKCLGILPIKLMCHYDGIYNNEFEGLDSNLETVLLPEYAFKAFTIGK
jgi:peptidase E